MKDLRADLNTIINGKIFSSYTASVVFDIASKKYTGSVENGIKCLSDAASALKEIRTAVECGEMSKKANKSIDALNSLLMAV